MADQAESNGGTKASEEKLSDANSSAAFANETDSHQPISTASHAPGFCRDTTEPAARNGKVNLRVSTVDDKCDFPSSSKSLFPSHAAASMAGPSSKTYEDDVDADGVYAFGSADDAFKYAMAIDHDPDLVAAADYVLGPCSDEKCSYTEGYKKRQALYSCLTCCPESGGEPVGVCLACSLHCHDGHALVELYCKRLFRCDCGNSKFSGFECKLISKKEVINDKNQYSDNFWGKYCFCKRPFPDPDISEEESEKEEHAMHQCLICEDWFHLKCMGVKTNQIYTAPSATTTSSVSDGQNTGSAESGIDACVANGVSKDDAEVVNIEDAEGHEYQMLCTTCRPKHPFLNFYVQAFEQSVKNGAYTADDVTNDTWWRANIIRPAVHSSSGAVVNNSAVIESQFKTPVSVDKCYLIRLQALFGNDADDKKHINSIGKDSNVAADGKTVEISLSNNLAATKTDAAASVKPAFFDDEWLRNYLCSCSTCMRMYVDEDVAFLMDPEDSYTHYYSKALECKRKREEELEEMSEAESAKQLTKMISRRVNGGVDKPINPVVEVIMANAIGEFRRGFTEFATSKAQDGKTITGDDVRAFTDQLRKKLRSDMEKTTPSHDCSG